MSASVPGTVASRLRGVGQLLATVALTLGVVVLAGWAMRVPSLTRLRPESIPMAPLTALCFVVVGAGVWARVRWPESAPGRRAAATAAGLVTPGLAVLLAQHSFDLPPVFEERLFGVLGLSRADRIGYMSQVTVACFVLLSAALLSLTARGAGKRVFHEASACISLAVAAVQATVLLGYGYGTPFLYKSGLIPAAFPSALGFVALGLGILAAAGPETRLMRALTGDTTRSRLICAFLPAIVLMEVLEGWAGSFIIRSMDANPAVVTALTTSAEIAVVLTVIYWIAARVGGSLDRAEAALRESEERFKVIATSTLDHILMQDKDLRYVLVVNPQLGLTVEDMIGRTDHDILPKENADDFTRIKKGVLESGKPVRVTMPLVSPQGEAQYLEGSYVPRYDSAGQVDGLIGYFRNVTEIRKAEEARAFESSMRNLLLENLPGIAMVMKNGTREIVYLNKMAREAGAVVGSTCRGTWAGSETLCQFCLAPEVCATGSPRRLEVGTGTKFYESRWIPLTADLYVHYIFDLTENKRAAEERQRLQAQLVEAQRLEAVGQLSGGVAHNLNDLLTVINGYAAVLLLRMPAGAPERSAIGEIHRAGEQAERLARQFLAFSRKQVPDPEVLDLNEVIADMQGVLVWTAGEAVRVVFKPGELLGRALVDRYQMQQVIMNLAANARDAMPRGGTLTIRTENMARQVRLTVEDTGTGISKETRRHLFEPFFTTKGEGLGAGLGLATVHEIVTRSGGRIEVESEPGRGAAFHLWFPAVEAAPEAQEALESATPAGGSETILLVDDQEDVRRFAATVPESYGYRVLQASGGQQALERCAAERADMLLTDVIMSGMSGLELAALAGALQPAIRTLFLSGFSEQLHAQQGWNLGSAGFLQKPFSPAALAGMVREVLDSQPNRPPSVSGSCG